jgi:hypothetical protein
MQYRKDRLAAHGAEAFGAARAAPKSASKDRDRNIPELKNRQRRLRNRKDQAAAGSGSGSKRYRVARFGQGTALRPSGGKTNRHARATARFAFQGELATKLPYQPAHDGQTHAAAARGVALYIVRLEKIFRQAMLFFF